MKGRVGCNILFSTPLRILGESPSQSVRGSKMFCVSCWSLALYLCAASSGCRMVCFASSKCGFWTGRDLLTYLLTYAHNLISKPHSVPPYTPYTTELVVAGLKQYWTTSAVRFVKCFRSDTGGLASLGSRSGSVRCSAFVPDGRDGTDLCTQSNF